MENESTDVIKFGVSMLMLAAVVFFVLMSITWGRDISRNFNNDMGTQEDQSTQKYFQDTSQASGADMPVSGAYSLVESNINDISSIALVREDRNTKKEQAGWFEITPEGKIKFRLMYSSAVPHHGTDAIERSDVKFSFSTEFIKDSTGGDYNGEDIQASELWLRNNMSGRCNVRSFKTPEGSYALLIDLY